MNLSNDLQSYLSENAKTTKKQTSSSNGVASKLGLWTNQHEIQITNDSQTPMDSQQKGWFSSVRNPFVKQPTDDSIQRSRLERCCACLPTLGYYQRFMAFGALLLVGGVFFFVAFLQLPFLLLRARKFAALFTCGSLSCMASIFFLLGPAAFMQMAYNNMKSTTFYMLSLFGTLHTSLILQSTLLTVPLIIVQVISLIWMMLKNIPGGTSGIQFLSSMFTSVFRRSVSQTMPI